MTETPPEQSHPQLQTPIAAVAPSSLEYWCFTCEKLMPVEIYGDPIYIVCRECQNGHLEAIYQPPPLPTSLASYSIDQRRFGAKFFQALRLFSQVSSVEVPPQNQPSAVEILGQHCLYVLDFSSQNARGVSMPPNQQFMFEISDHRSRCPPSLMINPIEEGIAGEQFLRMLRLISQGAPDEFAPPNQPSVVELEAIIDQVPSALTLFVNDELTFGQRFLRMLCHITKIARDEVESPNQPPLQIDLWDEVEAMIESCVREVDYLAEEDDQRGSEIVHLWEEDGHSSHAIEGEEDNGYENGTFITNGLHEWGNLVSIEPHRLANIVADIGPRDDPIDDYSGDDDDYDYYEHRDEAGDYVGNPGDYLNAADYEALLQYLAESVTGARQGAPPASTRVVEALESVKIKCEGEILSCAICQDTVNIGEMAKKLPCGHGYHGDCIVAWLGSRNSCPLCRYELPTENLDYEVERKKRVAAESSSRGTNGDDYDYGDSDFDTEDQNGDGGDDSDFDTDYHNGEW